MISPRARKGGIFLVIALVLGVIAGVSPMPYAIEMPGPSYNTLGTQTVTAKDGTKTEVPLITVTGGPSYPTTGNLNMLTVYVQGNPQSHPNLFQVVSSWLDPNRTVIPMDAIYPPDQTQQQREDENQAEMVDSQQEAIAAAFTQMGEDVTDLKVDKIVDGSPATGKLKVGDIIVSLNGTPIQSVTQLRAALAKNGVSKPATFVYLRNKVTGTTQITPVLSGTSTSTVRVPIIQIVGSAVYNFPFKVTIKLNDVGGPSAGMMFALGVYDKLNPVNLTGGRKIAGTGTIDSTGVVGPIGGIRQKMIGARDAGAEYMLIPADNCDEAYGNIPQGLRGFSVTTMTDALAVLKVVSEPDSAAGRSQALDALPTCKAPASK